MDLSKKQLTALITLTAFLSGIAGGTLNYKVGDTYYCQSRDIVANCDKGLTASGLTCKISNRSNLRCPEPWKTINGYDVIDINVNTKEVNVFANECNYSCEIKSGKINSYTKCYCGEKEAYLGELV